MRVNELELLSAAGVEPCFLMDTGGETGRIPFSEAALALRPGMNLLDNGYFADPVNQRGMTEYVNPGYTIDRWAINSSTSKIKLNILNGYIKLTNTDNSIAAVIRQYFENLPPNTYTISVIHDNSLESGTIQWNGTTSVSIRMSFGNESISVLNGKICLSLFLDASKTIKIYAAKLELGTHQTLAHKEGDTCVLNDPPPNKALELLKCRRYFVPGSSEQLLGAKAVGSMLIVYVPCALRANPTVIPHKNGELQVFMADGWKTCKYYGINLLPTQCGIRYNPPDGVSLQEGTVYLTRYIPSLSCDL